MASDEYGNLDTESGGSISKPLSNKDLDTVIQQTVTNTDLNKNSQDFSSELRSTFNLGGFTEDTVLVDKIMESYANALESVGLNIVDPIQAYSTCFNKNMQTLSLDPQRPGNSYVFFTRPDLNLSAENILQTPFLSYIMKTTIGKLVGFYLQYPDSDRVEMSGMAAGGSFELDIRFKTDSVFDPLMTNTCKQLSGIKDIALEKWETEGDFSGHQLQYAQGSDGYDSIGDFNATFEDSYGSPIFLKHFIWTMYIHEVCKGTINPRLSYIRERIIDYTCSAYTFKLAEDNQTILRWAKFTGCFPTGVPMNTLEHSRDMKLDEFDEISIPYAYNAYEPMNPNIIKDFNRIAMRSAFVKGTDLTKLGQKDSKFLLRDQAAPDKLLDVAGVTPARLDNIWARTPVIIGNKLIFV